MISREKLRRFFWGLLLPLFLLTAIYRPRLDGYLNPYDEGLWLGAAQALLSGKAIYSQIFFHYGPLLGLLLELGVTVLPTTLLAIRGWFWFLNALGLLCIYACLLRWVKSDVLRIAYALFFAIVPLASPIPAIPMAARYGAGFLPFLFWPKTFDASRANTMRIFLSGLTSAAAFLITQEVGLASIMAGAFYLTVSPERLKRLGLYLAGVGLGLAFAGLVLLIDHRAGDYFHSAIWQTSTLVALERYSWPTLSTDSWQEAAVFCSFYLPIAFYVFLLVHGFYRKRFSQAHDRALMGFALYGLVAGIVAWMLPDRWHIYCVLSAGLFTWAVAADRVEPSRKNLAALGAILLGAFLLIPTYLARVDKDKRMKDFIRATHIERAGSVQIPFPQAAGYEFLVEWIQTHTRPDEPFLFYPYDGCIYYLANRPNPTSFPVLALAGTAAIQEQAVRELTHASPRWVIWDTENTHFQGVPIGEFLGKIHTWVTSNYTPRSKTGPFLFLERKAARGQNDKIAP